MKSLAIGILLLAHGGDADWNASVERLRAASDRRAPTELALGMADPRTIGAAAAALERRGAEKIVVVPLFVNSRSEVMDQTRFVLGLAKEPSPVMKAAAERMAAAHGGHGAHGHGAHGGHGAPAHGARGAHHMFSLERAVPRVPVVLAPALDDDPAVSGVLLERAKALSREPARETVVLVAHGPVDDGAMPAWRRALSAHAAFVKDRGGFREVSAFMLRDDAAPEVRAEAVARLRAAVAAGAKAGRTVVVPVLLARGGIERKLERDLKGLDYAWDGRTLLPHPAFDGWISSRAAAAAGGDDMRLAVLDGRP